MIRLAWPAAALLALACGTTPLEHKVAPQAANRVVSRVAVVPFSFDPFGAADVLPEEDGRIAADVVAARVAHALDEWSELDVVPPADVRLWLQGVASDPSGGQLGGELRSAFGVDAIMTGSVRRYRAREGGDRSVNRPASVWFDLELRTSEGVLLWEGRYDEVQSPLAEDPGSCGRARERGFRWVTAEALTRYGARELMRELGGASSAWR